MSEREDAQRRLATLTAAHDRIATAMYTVDTHPAWSRLSQGLVTGATAALAQQLRPEVDRLWASFGALGDALEQGRALLAARRFGGVPPELTALLTGPAVGLDPAGVPVDASTAPASRVGLDELAGRTERDCAGVLARLSEVDTATAAVAARGLDAAAQVEAVSALAQRLGEPAVAAPLRAAAAEIEQLDLADPVRAAPGGRLAPATLARLDALAGAVARARAELEAVAGVRDAYPQRRAGLAAVVDTVESAEAGVAGAFARAAEKIAEPGLGPVPAAAAVLRARLAELDALHDQAQADASQWSRLTMDMSTVETSAQRARARAEELRALADGLIARRDELRGRLAAYQAKAVANGLAEDARLTGLFSRAHDLLFSAPCDLRAATRAVHAYQTDLADLPGRRERSAADG
jgi:hypothetical protein